MVSLSNHVAISMRLNTRRQTTIVTPPRLPRYARNDKVSMRERPLPAEAISRHRPRRFRGIISATLSTQEI